MKLLNNIIHSFNFFTLPNMTVSHLLCILGMVNYSEVTGYPLVQHWKLRSIMYHVKLNHWTLSQGKTPSLFHLLGCIYWSSITTNMYDQVYSTFGWLGRCFRLAVPFLFGLLDWSDLTEEPSLWQISFAGWVVKQKCWFSVLCWSQMVCV